MNLYLISQEENSEYDTYDSAVVAAPDEESAKRIHPRGPECWQGYPSRTWCRTPSEVTAKYIGMASGEITAGTVICSSFNAG